MLKALYMLHWVMPLLCQDVVVDMLKDSLYFGEQWQFAFSMARVVNITQCVLTSEGRVNFHCHTPNSTHAFLYFVPVEAGNVTAKLVLPDREVTLWGTGVTNPFLPTSAFNLKLPSNTSFEPWLYLHNPLSEPVHLKEIYTTNSMFGVKIPDGTSWTVPAYSTRPVAKICIGTERMSGVSYIKIRSKSDELSLYLPIRVSQASQHLYQPIYNNGLHYPEGSLDFGTVFSPDGPRTLPLNILHTGSKVTLSAHVDADGLNVDAHGKLPCSGKTCTVKVTLDPSQLKCASGKITLKGGKYKLTVPYTVNVLNGSLQATNTKFYIGAKGKSAFAIELTNTVKSKLNIERILLDSEPLENDLKNVEYQEAMRVLLPEPRSTPDRFNRTLRVLTNLTEFVYKLEYFAGKVNLNVDGIKGATKVDLGTLSVEQKRLIELELYNPNPVTITVLHVSSDIASTFITLPGPPTSPGWNEMVPYSSLRYQLTVFSGNNEGKTIGHLRVKTNYSSQSFPIFFETSKGTVTAAFNGHISIDGAFPFKKSSEMVYLESSFEKHILEVVNVEVQDSRFMFELIENAVIHPGAKNLIGTIWYEPSCSSSTCYLGVKQRGNVAASRDLFLWREMQDKFREVQQESINVSLMVDTQLIKGFVIPVQVSHSWPRITPRGTVRFETTQLGNSSLNSVMIDNPSGYPLKIQPYISQSGGSELATIVAAQHAFKLNYISEAFSMDRTLQNEVYIIPPKSKFKVLVRFRPKTVGQHMSVLVVRNNLTSISSVLLKGEGGIGKILLAGQEPGGTILFDLNSSLLKDCGNMGLLTTVKKFPVAKNIGQLSVKINDVLINGRRCVGYGFRIMDCNHHGFTIKPNASHRIDVSFTPDFTISRVEVTFSLVLDDDSLDFTVIVSLPKSVLSTCSAEVVRPPWEGVLYALCIILSLTMLVCVVCFAFLDTNRVLKETLYDPRARWEKQRKSSVVKFLNFMKSIYMWLSTKPVYAEPVAEVHSVRHRSTVATQTGLDDSSEYQRTRERKGSVAERKKRQIPGKKDSTRRDKKKASIVDSYLEKVFSRSNCTESISSKENANNYNVERARSVTPIETTEDENSESSTETPIVAALQSPKMAASGCEQSVLIGQESSYKDAKERNFSPQNDRQGQDLFPPSLLHHSSSSRGDCKTGEHSNPNEPGNSLSATLPDVCVSAATASRQSKTAMQTPSPPVDHQMNMGPFGGINLNALSNSSTSQIPPRRNNHLRAEIPPRFKTKRDGINNNSHPSSLYRTSTSSVSHDIIANPARNVSYSAVVSGTAPTNSSNITQFGYSPQGSLITPPPGFTHRQPPLGVTSVNTHRATTHTNHSELNLNSSVNLLDPRSHEMSPIIRSIIETVTPSDKADRFSSTAWPFSHTSQLWGDSAWGDGPGASRYSHPEGSAYPTFLRSSAESGDLGLEISQRSWQVCDGPPANPRQTPPVISPTNDYSYTGTDIWATPGASSFPPPIGTPWTPFRGPALSSQSLDPNKKHQ